MKVWKRGMIQMLAAGLLFLAGAVTGSVATQHLAAGNKFGQPKTVIHIVAYKFRDATSQNDQDQAIAGIKDMAAKIPGIKNIWLKTERNQIRDWSGVYVIEFSSADAKALHHRLTVRPRQARNVARHPQP